MSPTASPLRVLVVGRGKVAHGIRHASRAHSGQARCRLRSLTQVSDADLAWAQLVLLAVPHGAIRTTAAVLAPRVPTPLPVLHLAGNRPANEADACQEHGALHPLASFASTQRPPSLRGVSFALAGTTRAIRMGKRLVRALGGRALETSRSPLQGPAYHAAAALVANGGAALAASGVDILVRLGLDKPSAQRGVASLLRTVASNVEQVGVPHALTGPIVRGDAATVAEHRAALRTLGGSGISTYDAIAQGILTCAVEAGLAPESVASVQRALRSGRRKTSPAH